MIIVKSMGGLGNQMFQYALYRALQEQGKEVYLDVSWHETPNTSYSGFLLDKYNTSMDFCNKEQLSLVFDDSMHIWDRIFRKLRKDKKLPIYEPEDKYSEFIPEILELEKGYLIGYWQTEKYFRNISQNIREELRLRIPITIENQKMLDKINTVNSISIHVRRGDYLGINAYTGICTEKYYKSAVAYMRKCYPDAVYFVFSNDIAWCRDFFADEKNMIYVEINDMQHGYYDMVLMQNCHHNIIANSSFSWWGAWLNRHKDKTIVAPSRWSNDGELPDIEFENWIRISAGGGEIVHK